MRQSTTLYWLLSLRVARRVLRDVDFRTAVMALQSGPHAESDREFLSQCGAMLSGGLDGALPAAECTQILGAVHLNVLGRSELGGQLSCVVLSTRASLFNHSCSPNVYHHTGNAATDGALPWQRPGNADPTLPSETAPSLAQLECPRRH